MEKKTIIPRQVANEAAFFIERWGENIRYAGRTKGRDYYHYVFPEDMEVGFPVLIEYDHGRARRLEGQELHNIMQLLFNE